MKLGDYAAIKKSFSEKDVFTFSDICGDKNAIHLDAEYGKFFKIYKNVSWYRIRYFNNI